MECRPYGAYAVYDARRWWLLWLLPLARFLLPVPYSHAALVRDLLPALLLTAYSFCKWRCCRYRLAESPDGRFHSVGVREGLFVRRTLHLCADDAASVEVERSPLLWLLRARRIRISTAGLRRRTDAVLYLTASRTRRLFSLNTKAYTRHRAALWPVTVLALTGSNAAVGLLTVAPLLRQMSLVLGETFSQNVAAVGDTLWAGLPPLLRTAANLVLLGWLVAALRTFFRYVGFYAQREGNQLHLVSGLFTRRDVLIDCAKITAVERRQTLTMQLLGVSSAVITAAGYGRDTGTRPVLIPAARPRALQNTLSRLLPEYPHCAALVPALSRARYVWAPLTFLGATAVLADRLWPPLIAAMAAVGAWWLLIRLLGQDRAGFGITDTAVTVCYPRGLALYRVQLPRCVTDCISVTQSPVQRWTGTCTVQVRCFGEKRRRHRVWGLPYAAVRELLKI